MMRGNRLIEGAMNEQNDIHEDAAATGVCIPLTDAVIDYLIDQMSADQRTEALRAYMREMRNMNNKDAEMFDISKDEIANAGE